MLHKTKKSVTIGEHLNVEHLIEASEPINTDEPLEVQDNPKSKSYLTPPRQKKQSLAQFQHDEVGPAFRFLKGNKFANALKLLINRRGKSEQSAERQLQFAILGGGNQCQNCHKFGLKGRCFSKHVKQCKKGMIYRISFARLQGKFFCYHGCAKFEKRECLIKHLMYHHCSTLWTWGLDWDLLKLSLEG